MDQQEVAMGNGDLLKDRQRSIETIEQNQAELDGINKRLSEIGKELSGQYGPQTDARIREVKKKQRQLEDRAKSLVDSIETNKAALQAVEGEIARIGGSDQQR
jgi:conjugal transfer/entry exclusion protein